MVQLIGRSHPGAAQLRCRALRARHCAGETARVARPTSTTTKSALRTRHRVPSQASRCTVLLEIGVPLSSSDPPTKPVPSSPFRASMLVLTLMWGRTPVAPGQRAPVEGLVDDLDQGVGAALLGGADVVLTQGLVEAVDGRPQRRRTLGIQKGVQLVHATQLAQVQVAPLRSEERRVGKER